MSCSTVLNDTLPVENHLAVIAAITPDSPADQAGLEAGMVIISVDGKPLRDVLDWLWLTDGNEIEIEAGSRLTSAVRPTAAPAVKPMAVLETTPIATRQLCLVRQSGQPWGIEFAETLFDGIRTCINNCGFCFIKMLPPGMRQSLYLRDDDYRLSFLQGNFITLTNFSDSDIQRIIDQRLSPLYVSLHATDPAVRLNLIGSNAQKGMLTLEKLMAAGIQAHIQIVLVYGCNDGAVLRETLDYCMAQPGVLSVGIVPAAYTRFADSSFSYSPTEAAALIDQLSDMAPFVQLSDEWYLLSGRQVPPSEYYDNYPQYENGIGMVRGFITDWEQSISDGMHTTRITAPDNRPIVITGTAFASVLTGLITKAGLLDRFEILAVSNQFFGGSVNVTGLLTSTDIIAAIRKHEMKKDLKKSPATNQPVIIPAVIFNSDGITLDGYSTIQLTEKLNHRLHVVTCISEIFDI